jgi:hypothetical protein
MGLVALGFDDFLHHARPGAARDLGVAGGKVSAGDLAVDEWLLLGFVLGMQQPPRGRFLGGVQALTFAGDPVEQVKHTALAAVDTESLLHNFCHERNDAAFRNWPLTRTGRGLPGSGRVVAEQSF